VADPYSAKMQESAEEKREYPRHAYAHPPTEAFVTVYPGGSGTPVRAEVRDLSQGGIGLQSEHSIRKKQVVRCTLSLPGVPVRIPTLMRVQWRRKVNDSYLIGLQFLI
jgi:PilZ domain